MTSLVDSWRPVAHVALLVIFLSFSTGIEDVYSNSFISPNSAHEDFLHDQKLLRQAARTSGPHEIHLESTEITATETTSTKPTSTDRGNSVRESTDGIVTSAPVHERAERSADPILSKTTGVDDLLLYKNVDDSLDSNDVELSGRIGSYIQPSKTDKDASSSGVRQTAVPSRSGEGEGAPHQARSLAEPPEIAPSATVTMAVNSFASQLPGHAGKGRQANPDIQDIITGIVKLLNGNVNVQANTAPGMGRPLRPLSTRINNRGPPRITDVPALPPDFDIPAPPLPPSPLGQMPPPLTSTRLPTPYPFDIPPSNMSPKRPYLPISDQGGNKHPPGFYRPITIPPWHRRRPPPRRPNVPPYKPMPPMPSDMISLTSEKPMEDILTLDLGSQLEEESQETKNEESRIPDEQEVKINSNFTDMPEVTTDILPDTSQPSVDDEITEFEKNKEKTPKPEKAAKKTVITPILPTTNTETLLETSSTSESPTSDLDSTATTSEISSKVLISATTTEKIVPSTVPNNTTLVTGGGINETSASGILAGISSSVPVLESSIQDALQTLKEELLGSNLTVSSTATEKLPDIMKTSVVPSKTEVVNTSSTSSLVTNESSLTSLPGFPYYPYRPRPGIVLDDTEYKPGGINRQPIITRPPIGAIGDIFDITVSAVQGPGGATAHQGKPYVIPVDIENVHHNPAQPDVITSPLGDEGFVSIDGKRTYLNLFGEDQPPATSVGAVIKPTAAAASNQVIGTGYAVVETEKPGTGKVKPTQRRPVYGRPTSRPNQPPVRIDTCIVGDDSTCDLAQHEVCRTEAGVSACHCRPGTARRKHRDPCRKVVAVLVSLRVDRLYERRVVWADELTDKESDSYQQLAYEAERALESAMSMTPFSDEYFGSQVNNIYRGDRSQGQAGVFVNMTLQLDENADTARPTVRGDIQKHLLGVIQRRSNNVGNSALWVDSPPGSVSSLQDLDECSSAELHDCHSLAKCVNVFGGFRCECDDGYRDPWVDSKHRAGRLCEQCSPQRCSNRGECKYRNGQEVCVCSGNYYGNQCELDGEVLGVAIGASVAAVIIIGLTLVCLVMWSRRWSREQKAAVGSPVFGYMATASNTVKTPVVGAPPYQLTLEDRLRWAQIADVMAQANHYAPEPGLTAPTRPSSAMFGYPHLGTLQHAANSLHGGGTLPPVPLPRLNLQAQLAGRAASIHGMRPLDNSSSSEEEDKADLLGRNFQVPRPKSRSNASVANQSGIYYDVDYDQNDIYKHSGGIPMSTYGRTPFYRN